VHVVGFAQPVGDRRLDLVTMSNAEHVGVFRPRSFHHLPHLRRLDRAAEHDPQFEVLRLRPDEEVADLLRKHDRVV